MILVYARGVIRRDWRVIACGHGVMALSNQLFLELVLRVTFGAAMAVDKLVSLSVKQHPVT